jgi:hypothetical protein
MPFFLFFFFLFIYSKGGGGRNFFFLFWQWMRARVRSLDGGVDPFLLFGPMVKNRHSPFFSFSQKIGASFYSFLPHRIVKGRWLERLFFFFFLDGHIITAFISYIQSAWGFPSSACIHAPLNSVFERDEFRFILFLFKFYHWGVDRWPHPPLLH